MAGPWVRWRIIDIYTGEEFQFYPNPKEMTSPFPERNIHTRATTAVNGTTLFIEGSPQPVEWTFGGDILDGVHYEELRKWVYDRTGRRVVVTDHFGRRILCVLKKFDPTPKRSLGKYWRHTYTITAVVVSVGKSTVGEVPV